MIDTDKYEGHTPGPWKTNPNDLGTRIDGSSNEEIATVHNYAPANRANRELIADAPLLLAEVKRSRRTIELLAADYDSLISDLLRASVGDLVIGEVYEKYLMGVNDE